MNLKTFIIMGRSGCGKGTQARMIKDFLEKKDNKKIVYLEMGDLFRKFWQEKDYTHSLSKKIMEKGDLQPAFLQIYLWAKYFLENLQGDEHVIIDGTPRRSLDAEVMNSAFEFYGRRKPDFIFLNVSRQWAKDRVVERIKIAGREEDLLHPEIIDRRLDWYEKHVEPVIDFFRDKPNYNFVEVDGERSINDVHQDILSKTRLV